MLAAVAAALVLSYVGASAGAGGPRTATSDATLTRPYGAHGVATEDLTRSPVEAPVLLGRGRVTTARTAVETGPSRAGARCSAAVTLRPRWLGWRNPGQLRVGGRADEDPGAS